VAKAAVDELRGYFEAQLIGIKADLETISKKQQTIISSFNQLREFVQAKTIPRSTAPVPVPVAGNYPPAVPFVAPPPYAVGQYPPPAARGAPKQSAAVPRRVIPKVVPVKLPSIVDESVPVMTDLLPDATFEVENSIPVSVDARAIRWTSKEETLVCLDTIILDGFISIEWRIAALPAGLLPFFVPKLLFICILHSSIPFFSSICLQRVLSESDSSSKQWAT
jgi:hypothetical protein